MDNVDTLSQALQKAMAELQKFESESARMAKSMEALREEIDLLDRARAAVLKRLSSGELASIKLVAAERQAEKGKPSLKNDVLEVVETMKNEGGISAALVAELLQDLKGYKPKTKQTFYSSVYITLKRLAEKGEVTAIKGEKGLMFRRPTPTRQISFQ